MGTFPDIMQLIGAVSRSRIGKETVNHPHLAILTRREPHKKHASPDKSGLQLYSFFGRFHWDSQFTELRIEPDIVNVECPGSTAFNADGQFSDAREIATDR